MLHSDIVDSINVRLDFRVSLKQLVDEYGPPEKIIALPLIEHKAVTRVSLLYLQRGFIAVLPDISQKEPVELSESTSIQELIYHPSVLTPEELYQDVFQSPENVREFSMRYSYDWSGYGPIKIVQP